MSVLRGYKFVRVNSEREWRFSLLIYFYVSANHPYFSPKTELRRAQLNGIGRMHMKGAKRP